MVTVTPEAEKYISDLLTKSQKNGYGVEVYIVGKTCSAYQFGMAFLEKPKEEQIVDETVPSFHMFYDEETKVALDPCVIDIIDDPNFGLALTITDPNNKGCETCGGCH